MTEQTTLSVDTLLLELNFWNGDIRIVMAGPGNICCISGRGNMEVIGRAGTYTRAIQNAVIELAGKMDAKEDRKYHRVLAEEADQVKNEIEQGKQRVIG